MMSAQIINSDTGNSHRSRGWWLRKSFGWTPKNKSSGYLQTALKGRVTEVRRKGWGTLVLLSMWEVRKFLLQLWLTRAYPWLRAPTGSDKMKGTQNPRVVCVVNVRDNLRVFTVWFGLDWFWVNNQSDPYNTIYCRIESI